MNQLLTEYGYIIMARLGVNVQPACIEHCTGYIALAVKATLSEINKFTQELNALYGIVAKCSIMTI